MAFNYKKYGGWIMKFLFFATSATFALAVCLVSSARAQDSNASTMQSGLDDIVVTARRSEERLQDVPVAVSAFNADTLETRNVTDVQSLANIAPGLSITPANSPTTLIVTIRGLGNTNPNTGADAAVGLYFNDVPINLQNGTNIGMFDLEGVQVLKGPQGTLFGRNTTGGAILLNAAKPTHRLEGHVQGGGTFFRAGNGWQGEAVINLPLGETLAVRGGISLVDRDGYVRNIAPRDTPVSAYGYVPLPQGRTNFKNELPQTSQAWRFGALWTPVDGLENLFFYDGAFLKSTGLPTYPTALNPSGAIVNFAPFLGFPDPSAAYAALNEYKKDYWWATMSIGANPLILRTHTLSNTTTVDLSDTVTLKNIAGYRHVRETYSQDIVGLGAAYYNYRQQTGGYNFSDELQLQGRAIDGRLTWVGGLFYFEESRFNKSDRTNSFGGPGNTTDYASRSKSYSAFGQASLKVTDTLSLTAGARYTIDKRSAILSRPLPDATGTLVGCAFPGLTVDACSLNGAKTFKAFTYTLSADYKIDVDTLIYVASRKGYRSGGFSSTQSTTGDGTLIPFKSEKITDYEIGFKRDWHLGGDVALRTNLAAYHQQYSDIQRLAVDAADFTNQLIINVPKAKVDGGEFEATLAVGRGFNISYGFSYVKPRYQNFVIAGVDNSDNSFSYAPRRTHTLSGTATLPIPETAGTLSLTADWARRSTAFHDDQIQTTRGGLYPAETLTVPAYSMVGANLRWTGVMQSNFDLELFVTNLTNAKILPNGTPNTYQTLGNGIGFYGVAPRMMGFNLRYNFGA